MPRTQTKGTDIGDGSICRTDLNTAIAGQAVITKIVEAASSGIKINASTGVEPGTGDVSFKVDQTMFAPLDKGTTAGQIPTWNGSKWTPSTPSSYEYWKIKATLKDTYCSFYNGYAFLNINIAALGWRVPSNIDYNTIITSLGGQNVAGGHLKEAGLTHWNSPNTGADNSSGFNALPCGQVMFGAYSGFGFIAVWATTTMNVDNPYCGLSVYVANSNGLVDISSQQMKTGGNSVRLIKNSTTLTNGQAGIYKGNDGKVYNTICIGGIEIKMA